MTEQHIRFAHAARTAEVIESLRARCGDAHADMAGYAATALVQIRQMHALIHQQDTDIDKEAALCLGFGVLQQSLIKLFAAAGVSLDDVAILLPLIMQDLDDAAKSVGAGGSGGLHS